MNTVNFSDLMGTLFKFAIKMTGLCLSIYELRISLKLLYFHVSWNLYFNLIAKFPV